VSEPSENRGASPTTSSVVACRRQNPTASGFLYSHLISTHRYQIKCCEFCRTAVYFSSGHGVKSSVPGGLGDELDTRADAEFGVDVAEVSLDGARRHEKPCGGFFVA
jgi:hypothetical protein